ncbi:hypothetical protein BGZ47_000717 [Haplosporangium gracile]|nr:hypothetical protein BGZ47_000717 [Haplosporangium gracile]
MNTPGNSSSEDTKEYYNATVTTSTWDQLQGQNLPVVTKMVSDPVSDSNILNNDSSHVHQNTTDAAETGVTGFPSDPEKRGYNREASIQSNNSSTDSTMTALDPVAIKKLRSKIDWRLVPLVSVLYLCAFLDRVNIGNAKVAGIAVDLKLTPEEYNWSLSIFFIG